MKKFLLTLCALVAASSAFADIQGQYAISKSAGADVGDAHTFASGEAWEGDAENSWEFNVSYTGQDNAYEIRNLMNWDESMVAVYDEVEGTLTVPAGIVVDEEYGTMVCGGLDGYQTAQGVMDYCDANGSWLNGSRALKDIVLRVDGDNITLESVILYYYDGGYDGYWGYAGGIYTTIEAAKAAPAPAADIAGTYFVTSYSGKTTGDDYKFASGEEWEGNAEDGWNVEITAGEAEGYYTIVNLFGWADKLEAWYDAEGGKLLIAPASVIDEEDDARICGGLSGYNTAQGVMDYCDANASWIYNSRELKDVVLVVDENGNIMLDSPVLIYYGYDYDGVYGYAYAMYLTLTMEKSTGIQGVAAADENAPVEYFNMQGMRIENPAAGQLVIRRQGKAASKIIIR